MPLILDLDVADLGATRFAISALSETITGLQQLGYRAPREGSRRWLEWAREELAARPLVLPRTWPLLVNNRGSWPQFLLPAPSGPRTTIGDSLELMQQTAARQVRASLHRVFGDNLPDSAAELHAHPAAGLKMIAAELRQAHDRLIAPHWSRIRAVLEADIAYRSTRLATGGAEHLFADLHPDLRWDHGRLSLDHDPRDRSITVAPGGLVLMPVALGPPQVLVKGATSTQTTLRYPARGIGTLWTAGTRPVPGRTVRLLGRHRAQLLEALRTPATTTDLAAALGVTASAVCQHLAILRESGLIPANDSGATYFTGPPNADWTYSTALLLYIPGARREPTRHPHRHPDSPTWSGRSLTPATKRPEGFTSGAAGTRPWS